MANIEDVYKRLNELHAEILSITIAGILDQATETKQDQLISVVSKEAKQDAHTVIFNSINDVLDQMELNQDQQSAILNAINASITSTNLKLDDVNTELDNISAIDYATSAKQDTIIGHVDGIEGTLTSIDGKDFATSAKQEDVKTKLDTIITNTDLGENASITDVLVDDLGDTLLSANTQRKEAIIYNRGVDPIWISYDNSPAVDKGFLLDKKEFLIEDRYLGIISAITLSGKTTNINITEVTL